MESHYDNTGSEKCQIKGVRRPGDTIQFMKYGYRDYVRQVLESSGRYLSEEMKKYEAWIGVMKARPCPSEPHSGGWEGLRRRRIGPRIKRSHPTAL